MDIKVLDKFTAEKIAAGEVIENPASVVKELVENSIDAEASSISVEIENGGKSLIAVTDNGKGIKPLDLPLAFTRFATSKLKAIDDLDNLASLGFRGEALPSIAAVSKVILITRNANALSASKIVIEGGEIIEELEAGAPYGTRVEVKDLFYNTPGRFKFLRADSVESARISTLLSEMALAYPEVAFLLKNGKRTVLKTTGDGKLLHVIGSLYGDEVAGAMIAVNRKESDSGIHLSGYTSAPTITRSSRRWITLIINGRLVKNAMLTNALERGYSDLIPRQRHPIAVMSISLPPDRLDVNVHPAKTEIRFLDPETVKKVVYRAVKQAAYNISREIESFKGISYTSDKSISNDQTAYIQENSLFDTSYKSYNTRDTDQTGKPLNEYNVIDETQKNTHRLIGQFLQSYLLVQSGEDLLVIDQHAAHERINYNYLESSSTTNHAKGSIQLTMPVKLDLPPAWHDRLQELIPLLNSSGFNLELIGEDSYVIRSVPFNFSNDTRSEQVYDLIETLITADYDNRDEYEQLVRKTIACHRSVKAKQALSRDEMEILIKKWEQTPNSDYCPHGRPTVIRFNRSQIEKWFHRKGN